MKTKIIVALLILMIGTHSYGQASSDSAKGPGIVLGGLKVGTQAPPLMVAEWLSKAPDMKGKFVALDFWGPSCKPCISGFPHVNELSGKFRDKVVFIATTTNDDPASIYTYDGPKIDFYSMMVTPKVFEENYKIVGIPSMLVIDPKGVVRFFGNGHDLTSEQLEQLIATYGMSSCASGQSLDFSGKIAGLKSGTMVILTDLREPKEIKGRRFHDTAYVSDGAFEFKTRLPGAGSYVLRIGLIGDAQEHRVFYLAAGKVNLVGVRGELNKATISSDDPFMKDYLRFTSDLEGQEVFARERVLRDSMIMLCGVMGSYDGLKGHEGTEGRFFAVTEEVSDKKFSVAKSWIAANPRSDINAWVIYTFMLNKLHKGEVKTLYANLNENAKRSFPGIVLKFKSL